jgi:NAD(P)-dependent dehydrogenase (short-subunit alcohol dehydrogenase family)
MAMFLCEERKPLALHAISVQCLPALELDGCIPTTSTGDESIDYSSLSLSARIHTLPFSLKLLVAAVEDKTALVTGSSRGFGRAIALLLAREGADVAIADIAGQLRPGRFSEPASEEEFEQTIRDIEALGRAAIGIKVDVTKADQCARMAQETLDAFGKIDILCANAGVFSLAPSWELTEEEWDLLMAVNLKGVWLTTKYIVPHMVKRRYGKIIVTSSRNGLRAEANYAHYNASKFGVIGYMKSLAIELGPYEINVNAVCPTQMTDKSRPPHLSSSPYWDQVVGRPNASYEEFDEASGRENLFERGGQPDFSHVAQGVLWLASDASRLVTGHALPLDAGWIAKRGG